MVLCPRCGGSALLAVDLDPADDTGRPSSAVLCASCDLRHPTGGPVVLWFVVNDQIGTAEQMDELTGLLLPWVEDVSPPSVDSAALQATVDAWAAAAAAPAVAGAGLMCDFCEAAVPRWAYRADETAGAIPAGDWFACDTCRPYVDAREWAGLAGAVGDDRTESWVAFEGAAPCAARPWPPRSPIRRWP